MLGGEGSYHLAVKLGNMRTRGYKPSTPMLGGEGSYHSALIVDSVVLPSGDMLKGTAMHLSGIAMMK